MFSSESIYVNMFILFVQCTIYAVTNSMAIVYAMLYCSWRTVPSYPWYDKVAANHKAAQLAWLYDAQAWLEKADKHSMLLHRQLTGLPNSPPDRVANFSVTIATNLFHVCVISWSSFLCTLNEAVYRWCSKLFPRCLDIVKLFYSRCSKLFPSWVTLDIVNSSLNCV